MSLTSHSPALTTHAPTAAGAVRKDRALLDCRLVEGAVWDKLVSTFDGVCQEQLHAYASLRWPGVALEPVLFSDDNEPVGGALVMLQRLPLGVATVALVKWGPFLANAEGRDRDALMGRMIDTLVAEYARKRSMMVSIMPHAEAGETNRMAVMLGSRGFKSGVGVKFPMRYVVDVSLDDEARLAAFGQKWRYNLRKAMKAGLEFTVGAPGDIGRFMTLYQAMSERKLFPDYSGIDTLEGLMAMPDGTARPELFFVSQGEKTIAGAAIFTAGTTACYLYGATDDAALDLRAGYLLHWHIIRWLRDNTRARLYDLGGTDGFAGLHQFKSGMVGDAGHISPLPPTMNFASHLPAYVAGTAAYKAREILTRSRDAALATRLELQKRFRRGARTQG
ncbi:GNAT family N-acetyltransferase [Pelagibacterium flavum]|uniref:GNAT family N-acetyltransferase n=1 Tax=Pelagibacterium flavum TaxID=2984530 RepID=A0ABY6IWB5_9HYPH|nr:GNAT family N-acetyltransferase [Pelagibacterium sp. YIM 151497]UYQ73704.1 GNAT family N-acetyltransferase [Pelagibacterium sp. YIM 151497]